METSDDDEASEESKDLEDEQQPSVPWSNLPSLAIENIYTFINREDQSSMSQVCKNWSIEYSSPCLWRTMTFYLPEQLCLHTTDMPEVRAAFRYGKFFHHVQIVCRRMRFSMVGVIKRQLKLFLDALTSNSKLLSISLTDLSSYYRTLNDEELKDFRHSLRSVIQVQNRLQSVTFTNTGFEKDLALELLQLILVHNSKTLKELVLIDFMDKASSNAIVTLDVSSTVNKVLMTLEKLTIDYSRYFEGIITSFCENGSEIRLLEKGTLETIVLFCDGADKVNYAGIQPAVWDYFQKIFPSLRLDLYVEVVGRQARNGFETFIVRHMPVRSLNLEWDASQSNIVSVLRHLTSCGINWNLESLTVSGLKNTKNLGEEMVPFLQMFPILKYIQLDLMGRVRDLHILFEHWILNGVMSLKNVHVTIGSVRDRASISYYSGLSEFYTPLLERMDLNVIVITERL